MRYLRESVGGPEVPAVSSRDCLPLRYHRPRPRRRARAHTRRVFAIRMASRKLPDRLGDKSWGMSAFLTEFLYTLGRRHGRTAGGVGPPSPAGEVSAMPEPLRLLMVED